jgi:large subunit ribosomal protein L27
VDAILIVYADVPGSNAGPLTLVFRRWATKKAAGSTQNGRDSHAKFLGVKKFGGEVEPYGF